MGSYEFEVEIFHSFQFLLKALKIFNLAQFSNLLYAVL